jgi:hypothetical protein
MYFIRQFYSRSKIFYVSNVPGQRRYFLFHLPQSLSLFYFDGRGILEATMAFIVLKKITGVFCSFYIDCIYFMSQKVSLHSNFQSPAKSLLCFLLISPF